jgi:hypothetical protein
MQKQTDVWPGGTRRTALIPALLVSLRQTGLWLPGSAYAPRPVPGTLRSGTNAARHSQFAR